MFTFTKSNIYLVVTESHFAAKTVQKLNNLLIEFIIRVTVPFSETNFATTSAALESHLAESSLTLFCASSPQPFFPWLPSSQIFLLCPFNSFLSDNQALLYCSSLSTNAISLLIALTLAFHQGHSFIGTARETCVLLLFWGSFQAIVSLSCWKDNILGTKQPNQSLTTPHLCCLDTYHAPKVIQAFELLTQSLLFQHSTHCPEGLQCSLGLFIQNFGWAVIDFLKPNDLDLPPF